jgi:nicotinate-nucleotide adenylyltransferase
VARRVQSAVQVGILGGSFDPVHLGHLVVGETARDQLALDRVLFIPAASPPHKLGRVLASARDRLAMLRLAIRDNPGLDWSDLEIRRGGTSYTLDTLLELRRKLGPAAGLHFLIGADSALELHTWHRARELLDLARFVIIPRPGFDTEELDRLRGALGAGRVARLKRSLLRSPHLAISSTDLRERVASGRSIRYLVPEPVRRYIERHALYRGAGPR